jgi:alkanesulfonate monooxygenase SsuD/methylene tetrahydromethanopterin reductase-like flavin-dependent oxidoreductase (luciferase family)
LKENRTLPGGWSPSANPIPHPSGGWINLEQKVSIYVAASGPRTLELAAEIGDGVILFGTVADSLLEYATNHIRGGAERAGKRVEDLYICVLTPISRRQAA